MFSLGFTLCHVKMQLPKSLIFASFFHPDDDDSQKQHNNHRKRKKTIIFNKESKNIITQRINNFFMSWYSNDGTIVNDTIFPYLI